MKKVFSQQDLEKKMFSNTSDLSKREIKMLIDKELSKNSEDVDTDYIDLCFELMSMHEKTKNEFVSNKSRYIKKSIMIAAIIMVILVSLISVSAIYFNIPEKISKIINGNAVLQYPMENADTTADGYALLETDLAKELESFGITPITFPEDLIGNNCKITEIVNTTTDETVSLEAKVTFIYNGFESELRISHFKPYDEFVGLGFVNDITFGELIKVNGLDVLIFAQDELCTIKYNDRLTEYTIYLYCNFETAKEFVKTIK